MEGSLESNGTWIRRSIAEVTAETPDDCEATWTPKPQITPPITRVFDIFQELRGPISTGNHEAPGPEAQGGEEIISDFSDDMNHDTGASPIPPLKSDTRDTIQAETNAPSHANAPNSSSLPIVDEIPPVTGSTEEQPVEERRGAEETISSSPSFSMQPTKQDEPESLMSSGENCRSQDSIDGQGLPHPLLSPILAADDDSDLADTLTTVKPQIEGTSLPSNTERSTTGTPSFLTKDLSTSTEVRKTYVDSDTRDSPPAVHEASCSNVQSAAEIIQQTPEIGPSIDTNPLEGEAIEETKAIQDEDHAPRTDASCARELENVTTLPVPQVKSKPKLIGKDDRQLAPESEAAVP